MSNYVKHSNGVLETVMFFFLFKIEIHAHAIMMDMVFIKRFTQVQFTKDIVFLSMIQN